MSRYWIGTPGQKLEKFSALDEDIFLEEVKSRRPKKSARLTPSALAALRETFQQYTLRIQTFDGESLSLERKL